jgi:hypothetical protein
VSRALEKSHKNFIPEKSKIRRLSHVVNEKHVDVLYCVDTLLPEPMFIENMDRGKMDWHALPLGMLIELAKTVKPVAKQNHFFSQSSDSAPFAH